MQGNKKCQFCASWIPSTAIVCPQCKRDLGSPPTPAPVQRPVPEKKSSLPELTKPAGCFMQLLGAPLVIFGLFGAFSPEAWLRYSSLLVLLLGGFLLYWGRQPSGV